MIRNGSYLSKENSEMIDNFNALDRIELAEHGTPFCACGQPTSAAARPDGIWLECLSLRAPAAGRIGRLMAVLTPGSHTRELIVEMVADAA
jgi:hypothetical protein